MTSTPQPYDATLPEDGTHWLDQILRDMQAPAGDNGFDISDFSLPPSLMMMSPLTDELLYCSPDPSALANGNSSLSDVFEWTDLPPATPVPVPVHMKQSERVCMKDANTVQIFPLTGQLCSVSVDANNSHVSTRTVNHSVS